MQGLVLVRSNLKCSCNLTSSIQFVLYLQRLNHLPRLGSGLVMTCFSPCHLTLRALPYLHYLHPPCHVSVQSDFPLISFGVSCYPVSAPGKAASDLTTYTARQLPEIKRRDWTYII